MSYRSIRHYLVSFVGLFVLFLASMSGCTSSSGTNNGGGGGGGGGGGNNGGGNFSGRAACNANPTAGGRPRWTVLVYINAANNLQPDSLLNMAQMASLGSDNNVNIVVQWKQASCFDCGNPSFTGTRRYKVSQHSATEVQAITAGNTSSLDRDRLPNPTNFFDPVSGQADMGDWRVLNDFVKWGSANYPADNLMVVIWNHGAGWRPAIRSENRLKPTYRAFSQDNETQHEIQTWEAPGALAGTSQPIDVLAFDCSLMQMMEVAYELRNSARVLVGSEESPPGNGYRYDLWLSALKSAGLNPCTTSRDVLTTFVNYYRTNRPDFTNITQSILDLSKMQNVANALDNFAGQLRVNRNVEATLIQSARAQVQRYAYFDNKDLYHYAELIRTGSSSINLQQAASNLQTALTDATNGAIMLNGRGDTGQTNSNGLAVYVPSPTSVLVSYQNLALSKAGAAPQWFQFLKEQVR
jgi:clostripain